MTVLPEAILDLNPDLGYMTIFVALGFMPDTSITPTTTHHPQPTAYSPQPTADMGMVDHMAFIL